MAHCPDLWAGAVQLQAGLTAQGAPGRGLEPMAPAPCDL